MKETMLDNYMPIRVTVNGRVYRSMVPNTMTLLDYIRDELGLKGTKRSCDLGECGACTVIMNDEIVYSCQVLAVQANGADIVTIEGITQGFAGDTGLHPIQEALMDNGAIQCGYCTPGMVLAIKKLIDRYPDPTDEQIRYGLSGNICRCTGYVAIANAVKDAAGRLKGGC